MAVRKQKVLEFHEFCGKVLGLVLTTGQRVIAKVAFGNYDPIDLPEEERELALQMFGGLERVPDIARKYVLLRLGRGSGKTTLCAAFAVYTCVTFDCSTAGPGSIPYVIVVAPDRETAKLSVRMAREMIRSQPALERLVTSDQDQLIQLRRPDGRTVRIESFAATRGGSSMRGRDIMAILMDEAEFFTSNTESGGRDYAVNDKDIFDALTPRFMTGAKGMLISTPWPVETLMGKMFDENWTKCLTAVAIKAPTLLVRGGDQRIIDMVEQELSRDPENARRELFCELDGMSGGAFFDTNDLLNAYEEVDDFPIPYNPKWPVAVACDLGFKSDSSAISVVQFDGVRYRLMYTEEMKPKPGKHLKPSEVLKRIAHVTKLYGATGAVADSFYRESLKEQLAEAGLIVFDAPEGTRGVSECFQRTRQVLKEGLIRIPRCSINQRMIQQCKLIRGDSSHGGRVTIKIPRRAGMGHCDIVSAWVLAVHKLAYSSLKHQKPVYDLGTDEWAQESQRRLNEHFEKQQAKYLKDLEKTTKKAMDARKYRRNFAQGH